MVCSTDFKKLHNLYQSESVPKGISIVHFCQMNGIVYKHYERWYKTCHNAKVISVEIVSRDGFSEPCSPEVVSVLPLASTSALYSFQ